jgi:NitT/TauT family transport system substrate-binding protein
VKKTWIGPIIAVVILSTSILNLVSCSSKGYTGPSESVTVAYSPYVETALYWIAEDRHFFTQNGLIIAFSEYDSLVTAVDDELKGNVDIVGNVTEFPLASRGLSGVKLEAICSVAKSNTISIIGRRDRGINRLSDLKGKRVGSISGSITDFYLGRLLELNGMTLNDIILVNVKSAAGAATSVVNGDVDAVVVGQPFANSAKDQLGANGFLQSA